jgi:hypothetical protein
MKKQFYAIFASLILMLALNTSNAQDIVANGGFESWTAGVPDDWTTIETGITVTEETTTIHSGSAACNVLVTTGTQGNTDFRQNVDVVAGTTYDVSLWVYQVDTTVKVSIYVQGTANNGYSPYSDRLLEDQWQEMTFSFEATASENISIGTRYYDDLGFDTEATVIIDDFSITAQVVTEPTVTITNPTEGEVIPSSDVIVDFFVQNFVVGTAGTGDGHIHYYVDGGAAVMYYTTDPIELTGLADGGHTVILQLVDDAHQALIPNVADTVNFSVTAPTEVSTVAELRAGTIGEFYTLTGEAIVTYTRTSRNQKYIQDDTGGMLIDDNPGVITSNYDIGDGMTGLTGELSSFNDVLQFRPSADPGVASSSGNVTIPQVITLAELNANQSEYESELILLEGISFNDAGSDFTYNASFGVTQDAESGTFRTQFSEADYIGTSIPALANVTALGSGFFGSAQFVARFLADIQVLNPPANDQVCDAEEITVDGPAVTVDNTEATFDGDTASCWGTVGEGDVWLMFDFTPTTDANGVQISTTAGTSDDSHIALYTVDGCPDGPLTLTELACSEDIDNFDFMSFIEGIELAAGTYYIQCSTWSGAEGTYDVTVTSVNVIPPPAVEGQSFEEEMFVPECWTSIDADGDGQNWFQYGALNSAYAGLFSAASASWTASTGALTPDNYLVTPQLVLGTDEVLNYHVGAQDPSYPAEKYGVYISTTGNEEADFATELFVETMTNGDWENRNVDLSDYNGMTVYLAFRHYDVSDEFYLKLDNIILPGTAVDCATGVAEVEEKEFSIYPNPNNGQFSIVNEGIEGTYVIDIMDVTGKVVYSEQVQMNANSRTDINTGDINTGVYLVKMTNTKENYYRTIRMVIK